MHGWNLRYPSVTQEAKDSFAFPVKINSISIEIPLKDSKLYFFSLESFEESLYARDVFRKGKASMKKSKTCFYSNLVGKQKFHKVLGSALHSFKRKIGTKRLGYF